MGSVEVLPEELVEEHGNRTLVIAATSLIALNDGLDTTYIRAASGATWGAKFLFTVPTLPAGAVIESVAFKIRHSHFTSTFYGYTYEQVNPVSIFVGRETSGSPTYLGYTAKETFSGPSTSTSIQEVTFPARVKVNDPRGVAYLGELLRQTGARLYASFEVRRSTSANLARIYSAALVVNYNEPATVTILSPTGTEVVSRPSWTWSISDPDDDDQRSYDLRVFTDTQVAATGFSVDVAVPVYSAYQVTSAKTHKATKSIGASGNYVTYLRVGGPFVANTNMLSSWVSQAFVLSLTTPTAPTPAAVYDSQLNAIRVTARGTDNYLTYNQSTMEQQAEADWYPWAGTTITYSTTQAQQGTTSLRLTRTSTTGLAVAMTASNPGEDLSPVTAGDPISGLANFRADTTSRTCRVGILFSGADLAQVSHVFGTGVSDNSSGWTQGTINTTVPVGAVWARITVDAQSVVVGEFHYIDRVAMFPAASVTTWAVGGYATTERHVDVQRSIDAGVTWEDAPAELVAQDPQQQTVSYTDIEAEPGETVHYHLRVSAPNELGELMTSPWSATDDATMAAFVDWYLNDIDGQFGMPVKVRDFKHTPHVPGTVAYPLDGSAAVHSHDGYKDGTLSCKVWLLDSDSNVDFLDLARRGVTLLLRSVLKGEESNRWWVQISGDLPRSLLAASPTATETTPIRDAWDLESLTMVIVDRPEA